MDGDISESTNTETTFTGDNMAITAFGAQMPRERAWWVRSLWETAQGNMTITKFTSESSDAMIQKITEFTKTEAGDRAIISLVAPLVEDGVVDDDQREGNEEELKSYHQEIKISLLSHQVKEKGKMDNLKSVLNFRNTARQKLALWLADRLDQLGMSTLSGISYLYQLNGRKRKKTTLAKLAFAEDVRPPSAKRHRVWHNNSLGAGDNSVLVDTDKASYDMIQDGLTYAKDHNIRPIMVDGKPHYVVIVNTKTWGDIKKDPKFHNMLIGAGERGKNNPLFTGAMVTIDGAIIHEAQYAYTNSKAPDGDRWGATGNVTGARTLICGAQAMAFATIDIGRWVEKYFDYDKQLGISVDRAFGFLKPQFYSPTDESIEDFGVLAIDHAIAAEV